MAVNNFWRAREGTFVVLLALLWAFEILPGKFWYAESLCLQLSTNDMKIRFNPCMLAILRILLLSAWVQKNYQFIKRVRVTRAQLKGFCSNNYIWRLFLSARNYGLNSLASILTSCTFNWCMESHTPNVSLKMCLTIPNSVIALNMHLLH